MTNLKFTSEPKEYRTREGKKVRAMLHPFVENRLLCDDVFVRYRCGKFDCDGPDSFTDIVSEWREPIRVSGWVNVCADGNKYFSLTRQEADSCAGSGRIACIYVSGVEGQEPGE